MVKGIIISIVSGILLSGIWFGTNVLFNLLSSKLKIKVLGDWSIVLASLVPTIIILNYSELKMLNLEQLLNFKNWGILLMTVALTLLIISQNKASKYLSQEELLLSAADGIVMEIPQRMMMQSFIVILLERWQIDRYVAIPITAFIWCISICIQCQIFKKKFDLAIRNEILASFVFSMGIGYLFLKSEFIGFTMLAHFLERLLNGLFKNKKLSESTKVDKAI